MEDWDNYDGVCGTPQTTMSDIDLAMDEDESDFGSVYTINSGIGNAEVPFSSVHQGPFSFSEPQRMCFIPGLEVKTEIREYEHQPSYVLNPYLYTINVSHGPHHWTVRRRYKHFLYLHERVLMHHAKLSVPIPLKHHQNQRRNFRVRRDQPPSLPKRPEALLKIEDIHERMKLLEEYLNKLLRSVHYRNHHETLKFLETSHYSFITDLGCKSKESSVQKRSGGHRYTIGCCGCCKVACVGRWSTRWLIMKDSYVFYLHTDTGIIGDVLLVDKDFSVKIGRDDTGHPNGLIISNLSRRLFLKCWTHRKAREWMSHLSDNALTNGGDFIRDNRYESFVPERLDTQAKWFVDGADYFDAVAAALEAAKEEIFIADWWLSPEIYMKRPITEGDKWRLDKILERKANEGVMIFVLLYKEVELALGINSYYSKQRLHDLHPNNVKVLRHPDGVTLWAHHEKLVIVDQSVAFTGGFDLCFGRWDEHNHRLTDIGSVGLTFSPTSYGAVNLALSRSDPDLSDQDSTAPPTSPTLQSPTIVISPADDEEPRTPPPSLNQSLPLTLTRPKERAAPSTGASLNQTFPRDSCHSNDHSNLFLQVPYDSVDFREVPIRTTPTKTSTPKPRRKLRIIAERVRNSIKNSVRSRRPETEEAKVEKDKDEDSGFNCSPNELRLSPASMALLGLEGSSKLWIGKDYTNFIIKDFVHLDRPFADMINRYETPRMPWHDVGCVAHGAVARDLARHFIQRWNYTKIQKVKDSKDYPLLLPKSYVRIKFRPDLEGQTHRCQAQVVRSVGEWSTGIRHTERSIEKAYIECIKNAQHFIYIENQFFISIMNHSDVYNGVAAALFNRICKAYMQGRKFRVFVVMPLLPAFEGQLGTNGGATIQAVTHWNYQSICRGKKSLLENLTRVVGDPTNYIVFCGLRTHEELNGRLMSELLYVHSKLMIVDDLIVIVGSANINDRSLLGRRDSEVAMVFHDTDTRSATIQGQTVRVGVFASSLRIRLMREHLGDLMSSDKTINFSDPVCDEFYKNVWIRQAALNTAAYDKVFHCIPTDSVHSFEDLQRFRQQEPLSETNPELAREALKKLRGYLVLVPLQFLCKEALLPTVGTKEALVPNAVFT